MTADIKLQMELDHSIEDVWEALTNSTLLSEWVLETNFMPIVGYKIEFQAEPNELWDGVIRGNVLKVEKPYLLSYTWDSAGESTVVTFHLKQESKGKTQLSFEQLGFDDVTKARAKAIESTESAWKSKFKGLKKVLIKF